MENCGYFSLINCNSKDDCERANTQHCNRCTRNMLPMTDNMVFKSYKPFKIANTNVNITPCDNCGSNPKNGGSGICNCTLNLPKIT